MQRCPEPELMNGADQVAAYAAADFSAGDDVTIGLIRSLIDEHPLSNDPVVVDLGCGPGNITVLLARSLPEARVIGVDGAERMLEVARQCAADQNLAIEFLHRDLRQIQGLKADLVVSNSLLHQLHDPLLLWRVTSELANCGCRVLHRDLRRPESMAQLNRLQTLHLPDAPEVLSQDFRASLKAAFEPSEVADQLRMTGMKQLTVQLEGDRYLVVSGLVN